MKIYVASSWRNPEQPKVVAALREAGFEVYDFKNPRPDDHGFAWKQVALDRREDGFCTVGALQTALAHPIAERGFGYDFGAMKWADAFVLLLPSGRSAHLEAGWAIGAGKPTFVLMPEGQWFEPELMYKLANGVCGSMAELLDELCER